MKIEHSANERYRNLTLDPVAERAPRIARGVCRLLGDMGFAALTEFKLKSKRRADVIGVDKANIFVIIEIKSGLADLRADEKWHEYLDFCDLFYFAVDEAFPRDRLPTDCGLIIADALGAAIVRDAHHHKLNAARRRTQTLRLAMTAARRATAAS